MLRMHNKMINQAVCASAFVLYTNIKICAFPYLWSAAVVALSRRIDCPARIDFFRAGGGKLQKRSVPFSSVMHSCIVMCWVFFRPWKSPEDTFESY